MSQIKKQIKMNKLKSLVIASALFLGGMAFTACSSDTATTETEIAENVVYHCPMDCEDGKMYDEPGQCPVCEMDLVVFEEEVAE